ncbi:MAG: hypothetical protein IPJ76_13830 [Flavobacteriales bacterium]|nr:MAG: hypothetical protein IPJ76_13830 [Flavobacteriales bacterium]
MKRGPLLLSLALFSFIGLRWWSQHRLDQIATQNLGTTAQLDQLDTLAITKAVAALVISAIFMGAALFIVMKRGNETDRGWAFGIVGIVAMFWLG